MLLFAFVFVGVYIFCVVRVYYMFGASVFGARSHFAFVLFTCVYVCHVRVVIVRVYARMCMFVICRSCPCCSCSC